MKRKQNKVNRKILVFVGLIMGVFACFSWAERANASIAYPYLYGAENDPLYLAERDQLSTTMDVAELLERLSLFPENQWPAANADTQSNGDAGIFAQPPQETDDSGYTIGITTDETAPETDNQTASSEPEAMPETSPEASPDIAGGTEEDETDEFLRSTTVLGDDSIIVYSFEELNEALSNSNDYTTVYLGADIQMKSTGILISSTKAEVTIDGQPPGTTEKHVLSDYTSLSAASTINIRNNGFQHLTARNLILTGLNYYGPFTVYTNVSNAVITYENVQYTGPQLAFNRGGSVEIKDSDINIIAVSTTGGQEVAEANKVSLAGQVNIKHANANSVFWLAGSNTGLTVEADANVVVNGDIYFIYADSSAPIMTVEEGASLELYFKQVLTYGAHQLTSLSLQKNARFIYQQSSSIDYASVRIQSFLSVEKGAILEMQRSQGSKALIEMTASNATVNFDQPQRVKLANAQYAPIYFSGIGKLAIESNSINLWRSYQLSDQMSNMPDFIWNKNNTETLTLSSSFLATTPSSLVTNLQGGDPITDPLDATNFNLSSARVLLLGQYSLSGEASTQNVHGSTEADAALQATYEGKTWTGSASSDGSYMISFTDPFPPVESNVTVISHQNGLKARQFVAVADDSDAVLKFLNVPDELMFASTSIPPVTTIVARIDPDWTISVWDGRGAGSTWRLDVSIETPLQAYPQGTLRTLADALVFVDASSAVHPLSDIALAVHHGTTSSASQTDLSWPNDQGFLVQLKPGMGAPGETFQTQMMWQLIDAP